MKMNSIGIINKVEQYNKNKKKNKKKVTDEYDDFLREVDRLHDFASIRWQLGTTTWAVVGNDILSQKIVDKKGSD